MTNPLHIYASRDDCRRLLDKALELEKGIFIRHGEKKVLVSLRSRLYQFRHADRRVAMQIDGSIARSVYDSLVFLLTFNKPLGRFQLQIVASEALGNELDLTDADGNPVEI